MDLELEVHGTRPFVFFDLDGTLVNCGCYYKEATRTGARFIEQHTGMPFDHARDLIDAVDLAAVRSLPVELGFLRGRYPHSFVVALEAATRVMNKPFALTFEARDEIHAIADAVFDAPYTPYFGAEGVVRSMSAAGYGVALLTKGDHDVQYSKITRNGFDRLFDYVNITLRKDEETLANYMSVIGADPAQSWMVGDSLRDDIAPAHALGLHTVFVQEDPAHTWAYTHHHVEPDHVVGSVTELLSIIPRVAVETA